jgi:hypothetical protein
VSNAQACGRPINLAVPQRRRPLVVFAVVCMLCAAALVLRGAVVFPCLFVLAVRPRVAPPRYLSLGLRSLTLDGRTFQLKSVAIDIVGESLFVRTRKVRDVVDLGALRASVRRAFARHLEARQRLVRGPWRPSDEAIALEAMYVFNVPAVRVRNHVVRELLRSPGPWEATRAGDIYAREAPVLSSAYRQAFSVRAVGRL